MGVGESHMAIAFVEERKKQKKLIYVFAAVILITLIVLWLGVLRKPRKEEGAPLPFSAELRRAEIDFKVLESPTMKELQPFKEILPFEGKIGRENPFLPY